MKSYSRPAFFFSKQRRHMASNTSNTSDKRAREPWWFWLWTIWGVICGAVIGVADVSMAAGLAWAGAATLVGFLGLPLFSAICSILLERYGPLGRSGRRASDEPPAGASFVGHVYEESLQLLDPNRKDWRVLPRAAFAVGLVHGILGGGLVGALLPWTSAWQGTAQHGALWGMALGPTVLSPFYVLVIGLQLAATRRPRINVLSGIIDAACRDAENRGHSYLVPAHLLLAVLRASGERIVAIIGRDDEALRGVCEELDGELTNRRVDLEQSISHVAFDQVDEIIQTAIDEAKALKQPRVEAGHLLLGLLWAWPSGTTRALAQLGIDPVDPREDLRERLRRAA